MAEGGRVYFEQPQEPPLEEYLTPWTGLLAKAVFDELTLGELVATLHGKFNCVGIAVPIEGLQAEAYTMFLYREWILEPRFLRLMNGDQGFEGWVFDSQKKVRLRGDRAEIRLENGETFCGSSEISLIFAKRTESFDPVDLSVFFFNERNQDD